MLPYPTYYVCYADVLSRFSIGPLALFTFSWKENEFNIYRRRKAISQHLCNKPHTMYILSYISSQRNVIMERTLHDLSKGCQVVQRFVLKKSRILNIVSIVVSFYFIQACLGNRHSNTRPKVLILQGSCGQYTHLFLYLQFVRVASGN